YIILPGGFGTLDELFDVLTLMNTKIQNHLPFVLLGVNFWSGLIQWIKTQLLSKHYITEEELNCISLTDSIDEAIKIIKG
ncbi:MAG: LOG family protein, partial [Mucispirillum sp.]|nr:LOG family protein [Mucispirillum sp.]